MAFIEIRDVTFEYKMATENSDGASSKSNVGKSNTSKASHSSNAGNSVNVDNADNAGKEGSAGNQGKTGNISEAMGKALDGVSLGIEKGEFISIVGRNGSGKSTLAKTINGIFMPSHGTVSVDGMLTSEREKIFDIRSKVAMVFQNPDNQIVSSIVEDDIAFGPENLGIPPVEIRKRVDLALKAVDMYEHRTKAPHTLSGGQKQRIAIAGAIAMMPECIVFDEPTAMLDPMGRTKVLEIIKNLNSKGITVILITHFMEEATQADRIVVMDRGKICKDLTPKELFSDSASVIASGLELPIVAQLAVRLRERGIDLEQGILTSDEFAKSIISLSTRRD